MRPAAQLAGGLYPIIRRTRRPFIIQDDDAGPPPVPSPEAQPLTTGEATAPSANLRPEKECAKRATGEAKR